MPYYMSPSSTNIIAVTASKTGTNIFLGSTITVNLTTQGFNTGDVIYVATTGNNQSSTSSGVVTNYLGDLGTVSISIPTSRSDSTSTVSANFYSNAQFTNQVYAPFGGGTAPASLSSPLAAADPYFNYTTLLLSGIQKNDAFTDASVYVNTLYMYDAGSNDVSLPSVVNTSTPFVTTSSAGSVYFNGNNWLAATFRKEYQVGPKYNSAAWTKGVSWTGNVFPADFTIEAWININTANITGENCIASIYASGSWYFSVANGTIKFSSGYADFFSNSSIITGGVWTHVAAVIYNGILTFYKNGAVSGSTDVSANAGWVHQNPTDLNIGTRSGSLNMNGYISNLRITKGIAVYTGAFTTPTSPLQTTQAAGTNIAAINTASYVSFLSLQSNKSGTTNATFLDSGTGTFAVTRTGVPGQGTFSPFGNNWSTYFTGTSEALTLPSIGRYNIGTSDFTLEFWYNATSITLNYPYQPFNMGTNGSTSLSVIVKGTSVVNQINNITVQINNSSVINATTTLNLGSWYHIATVRSGTTVTLYVNGSVISTGTSNANIANSTINVGGMTWITTSSINGYLSNLRLTTSTAVYSGWPTNFTPPTTNFSLGYGSGYFNGSTYLTATNIIISSSTAISTNFTIESWCYFPSLPTNAGLWALTSNQLVLNPGASGPAVGWVNANNAWNVYYGASSSFAAISTGTLSANSWTHVALVRNSSTLTFYVNGTGYLVSASDTTNYQAISSTFLSIGAYYQPGYAMTGYLSNFRFVNGTAVYTGNFAVPTAPLTAINNTVILTLQNNNNPPVGVIAAAGTLAPSNFNPFTTTTNVSTTTILMCNTYRHVEAVLSTVTTIVSSPYISPFSPFNLITVYPTDYGSGYFNGSSDLLSIPAVPPGIPADFTAEAWVYMPNTGATQVAIASYGSSAGNFRWAIRSDGSIIQVWNGTSSLMGSSFKQIVNQWAHLAFVRCNGWVAVYVNGGLIQTAYGGSAAAAWANGSFQIGAVSGATFFQGYMSNYRHIRGIAAYSTGANFIPPTLPVGIYTGNTNTDVLFNGDNAAVYDATGKNTLISGVGTGTLVSSQTKFGTRALYFPGVSPNYYTTPSTPLSPNFHFGTGDFTIETWIYKISQPGGFGCIIDCRNGVSSALAPFLYLSNADPARLTMFYDGASTIAYHTANISLNTWYHVAVSRASGTTRLFVDGVVGTNTLADSNNYVINAPYIGRKSDANDGYWKGYMADFRVTKGIARYTATFTPPTLNLPNL